MVDSGKVERVSHALLEAWDRNLLTGLPSVQGLSATEAAAVGARLCDLRLARGERALGWKIGFTNRSIWARYGVDRPMWAPVYDSTLRLLDGTEARLSLAGLSQPRIEPEIAFGFAAAPRAGLSLEGLRACLAWVAPAFEIVHTHFDGWRFTAPDCAADFGLHGRLLVGPRVPVAGWGAGLADELAALAVELACDGVVKDRGVGRVVLDGPLHALKMLIDAMPAATPAWHVAAGDVVTTGTITDAWPLLPGQRWQTRLSDPRLAGLALEVLA
jgi:2-oxo-3-hexenedioate decarboxylase